MTATTTVHYACDNCGKRADVEPTDGRPLLPEGWRDLFPVFGDACSEHCAETLLVNRAKRQAADLFTATKALEPA
jgi:hypothetical protein